MNIERSHTVTQLYMCMIECGPLEFLEPWVPLGAGMSVWDEPLDKPNSLYSTCSPCGVMAQ